MEPPKHKRKCHICEHTIWECKLKCWLPYRADKLFYILLSLWRCHHKWPQQAIWLFPTNQGKPRTEKVAELRVIIVKHARGRGDMGGGSWALGTHLLYFCRGTETRIEDTDSSPPTKPIWLWKMSWTWGSGSVAPADPVSPQPWCPCCLMGNLELTLTELWHWSQKRQQRQQRRFWGGAVPCSPIPIIHLYQFSLKGLHPDWDSYFLPTPHALDVQAPQWSQLGSQLDWLYSGG